MIAAITVFVAAAQAKDQPQLTVEVLKAETVHWTTYLHDDGSAGKTTTDCDIYDTNASHFNHSDPCDLETYRLLFLFR